MKRIEVDNQIEFLMLNGLLYSSTLAAFAVILHRWASWCFRMIMVLADLKPSL
jgi:hypothetical protein